MILALLACSVLAAAPLDAAPQDRAAYEAAKAQAGRDPQEHVKLALWCEAHGLNAERTKHLAIAMLIDPKNAMARGLVGLVAFKGQWERPEAVSQKINDDPDLAAAVKQYAEKRAKALATPDAQWKLAMWCEENGLNEEARAHLRNVVQLDPKRGAAWMRLGYKQHGNQWVLTTELAAAKEERELQKHADYQWKPLLEKWRAGLSDKRRRPGAETALGSVVDPRAVPMVWLVFGTGKADRQLVAVQVLSQIDAATATRALAALAVFSDSAQVRRTATEALLRRDPREFAGTLVALIRDPIQFEVRPVNGAGSQGELFIKGVQSNLKRIYKTPSAPEMQLRPGDRIEFDASGYPVVRTVIKDGLMPNYTPYSPLAMTYVPTGTSPQQGQAFVDALSRLAPGSAAQVGGATHAAIANSSRYGPVGVLAANPYLPWGLNSLIPVPFTPTNGPLTYWAEREMDIPVGRMTEEAEKSAASSRQQLEDDVKKLEDYNAAVRKFDERLLPVLRQVAGEDLGEERLAWEAWWTELIGYKLAGQQSLEKALVVEEILPAYQPRSIDPTLGSQVVVYARLSCFAAGTMVRTRTGARAIETLKVGDVVLTQNVKTGALGYQPIVVVHHNPPSKTYRITLGKETIVSSAFHRFWKAGKGWVMARDLKPGDTLRTLGSLVQVDTMQEGPAEPVFNLDVAEDNDFFVGRSGALVHDNSLPDLRLAPFDAAPALAASALHRE